MNYIDNQGNEVFVSSGLGNDTFGTFRRSATGSIHRVKSPMMPMIESSEKAQSNLDVWAKKNQLKLSL